MGYDFESVFPEVMEGAAVGAAGIATGFLIIFYLLMMGLSIIAYVLNAAGMYRIAKRRGIHHAWLAWVPVGCNWLLGSISDHYQYIVKQKTTARRKILLTLSLILLGVTIALCVAAVVMVLSETGTGSSALSILMIAVMVISYLAMLGLAIAITVFCYIAYYDLFRSCRPNSAILFLILSIVFSVTLPVFVFACSSTDHGMPPRQVVRPATQIPYQQPPVEEDIPVVETQLVEDEEV